MYDGVDSCCHILVSMCAHTYTRVWVHVQTTAHKSGSEDNIRCQSCLLPCLKQGLLFAMVCPRLASLQAPESPVSASLSLHRRSGITDILHKPIFIWVPEMGT